MSGLRSSFSIVPAMSEYQSKRFLADHGMKVSEDRLAGTAEQAVAAAREIGGPVAVKLCGSSIAHKSERGLVRLGVLGDEAVQTAAVELLAAATASDGDVGLLVSEMVRGHREMIVGVVVTEQFGPVLMLGLGGILAEAVGEATFRLLPVSEADCQDLIDGVAAPEFLGPFRGEPAVDRAALAATLLSLAAAASSVEDLAAIDVNPLVICNGQPIAVDALILSTHDAASVS